MFDYKNTFSKFEDYPDRFELSIKTLYSAILMPGDAAIDCGAHVGKHAIPISKLIGPTGFCLAFEPIVEKFHILFERSLPLPSLFPVNAAVFDSNRLVEFTWLLDDPGKSSINIRQNLKKESIRKKVYPVVALRLDDYLPQLNYKFVKIDIEGAELLALRGMLSMLQRCRPLVHFELGIPSVAQFDYNVRDVYAFFSGIDYTIFDVIGNRLPSLALFEEVFLGGLVYDFFALPSEIADENRAMSGVREIWNV
jgi:FkbM family methyltransferase